MCTATDKCRGITGRIPGTRFLQKPFRRQDLAGKIREALDSERTTDGPE